MQLQYFNGATRAVSWSIIIVTVVMIRKGVLWKKKILYRKSKRKRNPIELFMFNDATTRIKGRLQLKVLSTLKRISTNQLVWPKHIDTLSIVSINQVMQWGFVDWSAFVITSLLETDQGPFFWIPCSHYYEI